MSSTPPTSQGSGQRAVGNVKQAVGNATATTSSWPRAKAQELKGESAEDRGRRQGRRPRTSPTRSPAAERPAAGRASAAPPTQFETKESLMNRDQFRGASRHLKGRAQTAIGGLAGDPARQVRGGRQPSRRRCAIRLRQRPRSGPNTSRRMGAISSARVRRQGKAYGTRAIGYVDDNRGRTSSPSPQSHSARAGSRTARVRA